VRIIKCVQGTPEWLQARIGLPTASGFENVLTAKTLKASASQGKYAAKLLAEWWLGVSLDEQSSAFMERGTQLEPEARNWYAFTTGRTVQEVGFCLHDDGIAGYSPDGLVDDDGLIEIKCPSPAVHMGYKLFGFDDYVLQTQGGLWITGRRWLDKVSYHPVIPSVVQRVERDEVVIAAIEREVRAFAGMLAKERDRLDKERAGVMAAAVDDVPF
jgi:hypothetical protein